MRAKVLFALSTLWFATGCSAQVKYVPLFGNAPPPGRFVRVDVKDQRPPDEGGGDPGRVGTVRGGYGNPAELRDEDPDAVTRLVTEATSDALASCGVGVRPESGDRLVAQVIRLWEDGYVGYEASVTLDLSVVDASGTTRWTGRVGGSASGTVLTYGAASDLVARALGTMARNLAKQCSTPEFQQALP